jgi:hypothetical protein
MSGVSTASAIGLGLSGISAISGIAGAAAGASGAGIKAQGQLLQGELQGEQQQEQTYATTYAGNQSEYQSQVAAYQAVVAQNNAKIAQMAGARVVQAGEVTAANTGLKGAATVGKIKANTAANNIDVNTGSAVAVRSDAARAAQLDAETALSDAKLQDWGYNTTAGTYEAQAGLETSESQLLATNAEELYGQATFEQGEIPAIQQGAGLAAEGTQIGGVASLLNSASSLPLKFTGFGSDSSGATPTVTASGPVGTGAGGSYVPADLGGILTAV